jgi:hypothetical protein
MVVCFLTSAIMSSVLVVANGGFGASDILPFLIWSFPFAVIIALIKRGMKDILDRFPLPIRYIVAAVVGGAGGVLWTYIVAFFLGVWFGAFSFPVLPCWMASGASGLIIGAGEYKNSRRLIVVEVFIVALIGLISTIGPKYLFDALSSNQKLEVVTVEWTPSSEPLTDSNVPKLDLSNDSELSNEDVALLKSLGLTGRLDYRGSMAIGSRGKPARVLIVIQHQVKEPVKLKQPNGVDIIYVQSEDGWKMYPPAAPTLERYIRIWADERDPRATQYSVERADSTRAGGTLVTWYDR